MNRNRSNIMTQERNLSRIEHLMMGVLKDMDFLIKRADKSATPVIISRDDYIKCNMEHLDNLNHYKETSHAEALKLINLTRTRIRTLLLKNRRFCESKVNFKFLMHSIDCAEINIP